MTPFESYCTYLAFKAHFNQKSYDFFKYNKKVNATRTSFDLRRDKYFFEKISATMNEEKFVQKMLAQVEINSNFWIKDILTEDNEVARKQIVKRLESFSYCFSEEMKNIEKQGLDLNDLIKIGNEHYPKFFDMKIRKELSVTSIIALDLLFNFIDKYNVVYESDVLWDGQKINDFKPFMIKYIDKAKVVHILQEIFI